MKKKLYVSAYEEYLNVSQSITHGFISLFLFVLPLIITNAYYNITETKLVAFYILSGIYVAAQLFVLFVFAVVNGKSFLNSIRIKLNFLDVAFLLFGFSYIISGAFSQFGSADVVFGIGSRYQGILTVLVYISLYFALTRTFSFSPRCLVWAGVGFSIVSVIALLNAVSVDPLGFYSELSAQNQGKYISTIGNINFYSAYYNLLLPVLVVGFCKSVDKKTFCVFGSFTVIGSIGMVFTASESFLFGFLISMVLLLAFFMNDKNALKRFLGTCCLFLFTITVYTYLYQSDLVKGVLNFAPSGLMLLISKPIIVLFLVLVFTCLLVVANKKPDLLPSIKKIYSIALIGCFVFGVSGIILINTVLKNVDLGALNSYLRFSAKWGTNRGQNWAFCINEFMNAPLVSKIFGFGPETYHNLTEKAGFYATKSLDQVHNEFLQYLISTGVFGLCAYLNIVFGTIKNCVRNARENAVAMSILCGLIAYWVQATVNIAQPFTTPLMFIFIAVLAKLSVFNSVQEENNRALRKGA